MLVTKEAIFEGKTIDDAIQHGLSALSLERDNISVEVVATPVRGIFGFGGSPAKVKLSYEFEDGTKPAPKVVQAPVAKTAPPSAPKMAPAQGQRPHVAAPAATAAPKAPPAPTAAQGQRPGTPTPRPEHSGKPLQKPARPPQPRAPRPAAPENTNPYTPVADSAAQRFLSEVFQILDMKVETDASTNGETLRLNLNGDAMGILIGRHGETLDAFQYLTGLVENNSEDNFEKVYLDIQGYRAKREETLITLAHRVAEKVKKLGKNVTLEAMNPYERRIIHSTLQEVAGISTFSVGFEPNRKIVVAFGEKHDKKNK